MIMEKKVYFRFAKKEDSLDLLSWRNDIETKKNAFNAHNINLNEHESWLNKTLSNPKKRLFIVLNETNHKIGQIRFDKEDDFSQIHITINPLFRRQGYGSLAIKKSIEMFFNNFETKGIIAKIKHENIASIKSFKNANFFEFSKEKDYIQMRYLKI